LGERDAESTEKGSPKGGDTKNSAIGFTPPPPGQEQEKSRVKHQGKVGRGRIRSLQ